MIATLKTGISCTLLLGTCVALSGCSGSDELLTETAGDISEGALTADQCMFFEVDGAVQICHRTSLTESVGCWHASSRLRDGGCSELSVRS